jgi:hypothetical protein
MRIFLALLTLAFAPRLAAAPDRLERDLGRGLSYCRVHVLPADLPAAAAPRGALVLDLRYARADDDAAPALAAWFNARTTSALVFVLVNAETAPAALAYFAGRESSAGVITLGALSAGFEPDIGLKIAPAAERTAYDALEQGTPLTSLLTDNSTKPRHDEASIAQDRISAPDDSTDDEVIEPAPVVRTPPPPVIDYTLLRAVHLHRALLALRKM